MTIIVVLIFMVVPLQYATYEYVLSVTFKAMCDLINNYMNNLSLSAYLLSISLSLIPDMGP